MKLIEIYKAVLKYCGLEADDQGFISTSLDDKHQPAFIDGLRMVLPTDHQLRNSNTKERIIFHPLTENILRGESEVIQKLKSALNVRLNMTIGIIGHALLEIVASPAVHARLSPEQGELLLAITDSDQKAVDSWQSVMLNGVKTNPDRLFTNIYLKRGGTHRDKRYSRVGIVTFPFYTNLIEGKVEKIRAKDKETFKQLMEFIFPNLQDAEEYNFGSDSHVAPYMEALLRSSANLASRLNDIILLYQEFIGEADKILFDAEWMEYFQDMDSLIPEIRKIPVQQGNDGVVPRTEEAPAPAAAPALMAPAPAVNYGAPASPPAVRPAEPVKTKRGLDFGAMTAANPALAMTPNPLAPQMAMNAWQVQQMQQAQRMPSWAAPQAPQMMPPGGMMPQGMPPVPLPQGAQMGPQGPFIMTPQGPVGIQLVQTPQGPMWQPMMPMGGGMPMGGMSPVPTWAGGGFR